MAGFLTALGSGRVLLMDGAMGSELRRHGLADDANSTSWNHLQPERVRAVHDAWRAAGAEVLLTNTFALGLMSAADRAGTIDEADCWARALALIGPAPVHRLAAVWPGEAVAFALPPGAGADAVLLETVSTPNVAALIERARAATQLPVLLSLTYQRDGAGRLATPSGHGPGWFARQARSLGIAALGINCGRDLDLSDCRSIIESYRAETDVPLFARPNAGTPIRAGNGWAYPRTPETMADQLPELLAAGVVMVGGCCGTGPEHIGAFRRVIDGWNATVG